MLRFTFNKPKFFLSKYMVIVDLQILDILHRGKLGLAILIYTLQTYKEFSVKL